MNSTLRTRLLLGISATIIITLSATHYGMHVLIKRQLFHEFDEALAAKVRSLAVLVEHSAGEVRIEFQQHPMQEFARSVRPEYYQVWRDDGSVLTRSRQLGIANLVHLQGDRVVPQIQAVRLPDGREGRAAGIRFLPNLEGELPEKLAVPQRNSAGEIADVDDDDDALDLDEIDYASRPYVVLVVARDTQDLQASLRALTWLLAGSGVLAATVILGVLAWLVTLNLKPLRFLAKQIGSVNEQNLDRRFELPNAPGELHPIVVRLNELMTCLETAFQREKTFTADVAHELRTPLAGIRSTLEVSLSRHRTEDVYRTSMQQCLKISEETETIISTLLSLSRIEAGHAVLDTDIVDLNLLLKKSWRSFQDRAAERNIEVTWPVAEQFVLKTDPSKLQVVVANLFDNATSYVDPGGQISISTTVDGTGNPHVLVTNTGCRLTEEEVGHASERFWRGDAARSATGIHSGLGLALSCRIMQFLEGEIHLNCKDGRFIADVQLSAASVEQLHEFGEDEAESGDIAAEVVSTELVAGANLKVRHSVAGR